MQIGCVHFTNISTRSNGSACISFLHISKLRLTRVCAVLIVCFFGVLFTGLKHRGRAHVACWINLIYSYFESVSSESCSDSCVLAPQNSETWQISLGVRGVEVQTHRNGIEDRCVYSLGTMSSRKRYHTTIRLSVICI